MDILLTIIDIRRFSLIIMHIYDLFVCLFFFLLFHCNKIIITKKHTYVFVFFTINLLQHKFLSSAVSNFHASRLMGPVFFRGCAFHLIPRLVNTVSFFFIIFLLLFPCTSAPLRRLETPSSCES